MSTCLTIGTFAMPHLGHAAFLRRCERFADRLIVGVNSDDFVEQYRGSKPLYSQEERLALISSIGYEAVLNDGPGRQLIELIRPDILTIGTDWARKDYYKQINVDQDYLDALGITMAYVPMRPVDISSTDVVQRVMDEWR